MNRYFSLLLNLLLSSTLFWGVPAAGDEHVEKRAYRSSANDHSTKNTEKNNREVSVVAGANSGEGAGD